MSDRSTFVVKDVYGRILGYIISLPNGNKEVKDRYGRILGKYDKPSNTTRDKYGRIVAQGEVPSMLIGNTY